ncbi:MAG: hypothetical protein HOM11_17105 [Methylococcales bacterium]|jgi:hypothetical protein|nr:hypothetical protein [Methylococcales bacterium]MBT7410342.1 hypothetical protein [Methylococcales bacterium]
MFSEECFDLVHRVSNEIELHSLLTPDSSSRLQFYLERLTETVTKSIASEKLQMDAVTTANIQMVLLTEAMYNLRKSDHHIQDTESLVEYAKQACHEINQVIQCDLVFMVVRNAEDGTLMTIAPPNWKDAYSGAS